MNEFGDAGVHITYYAQGSPAEQSETKPVPSSADDDDGASRERHRNVENNVNQQPLNRLPSLSAHPVIENRFYARRIKYIQIISDIHWGNGFVIHLKCHLHTEVDHRMTVLD